MYEAGIDLLEKDKVDIYYICSVIRGSKKHNDQQQD